MRRVGRRKGKYDAVTEVMIVFNGSYNDDDDDDWMKLNTEEEGEEEKKKEEGIDTYTHAYRLYDTLINVLLPLCAQR